jgi:hypothetical protein
MFLAVLNYQWYTFVSNTNILVQKKNLVLKADDVLFTTQSDFIISHNCRQKKIEIQLFTT